MGLWGHGFYSTEGCGENQRGTSYGTKGLTLELNNV